MSSRREAATSRRSAIPGAVRRAAVAIVSALAVIAFSEAFSESYMTHLEWTHPNPEQVESFRVLYAFSEAERAHPKSVDVGKPLQVDRFVWPIDVPAESTVWVAVVAVGRDEQVSEPTPWRRYDWRPGQGRLSLPGRPYLVTERAD